MFSGSADYRKIIYSLIFSTELGLTFKCSLDLKMLCWCCQKLLCDGPEYNELGEFQTSFPDYIVLYLYVHLTVTCMIIYGVCSPTLKKLFVTIFKPRAISHIVVPVMPFVCCLNYTKNMKQCWSPKKMQNEAEFSFWFHFVKKK